MAYQEYDPDTGDFGTTINSKGEIKVLRETARPVESGSRSATGSATGAAHVPEVEREAECESCGARGQWMPLGQFDAICPKCGGNKSPEPKPGSSPNAAGERQNPRNPVSDTK